MKRWAQVAMLSFLALLSALPIAAAAPPLRDPATLNAGERAALDRGEAVMAELAGDQGDGAQALFVLDSDRAQTWALLTDYRSFDRWMEGMKQVTMVTWPAPDVALMGVVIPSPIRDVQYVMRRRHTPQTRVSWTRESGDLKSVVGAYEFFDWADGRTLVRYHAIVDIGVWVPSFVKRFFTTKGLRGLITSIQAEARRRYPRLIAPTTP